MVSGNELKPVAAFFPSIDRTVLRDLDRQLRGAREQAEQPAVVPPEAARREDAPTRPDIAGVVEAVEQAASSMVSMADRIQRLESQVEQYDAANADLTRQLADAVQARDMAEATLRAERERGQRIEALASHHVARATTLERDRDMARADLTRVVDAITQALGTVSA